jgi:hypothetical protein
LGDEKVFVKFGELKLEVMGCRNAGFHPWKFCGLEKVVVVESCPALKTV